MNNRTFLECYYCVIRYKGETDEAYDLLDIISGSSVFIHYMC